MNYQKALEYTTLKHAGQTRKEGTVYITHPVAVAEILRSKGFSIDVQIMGLFHDLLEDTDAADEEIITLGNQEVLDVVKLLSKEGDYDMDEYISRISGNQKAAAVKLADRVHNLRSATVADDAFRKKYFIESIDYYMELAEQPFYIKGAFDILFQSDFQIALEGLYDTFYNEFYCESCKRFLLTEEKSEDSKDYDWGLCRTCAK